MTEIAVDETRKVTAKVEPANAPIASYAWSADSDALTIVADGDTAELTGVVAADVVRVTVDTVNADGTPGPSYSEDVTVVDAAAATPPVTPDAGPVAETVTFVWSDVQVAEGAEVAPSPSEELGGGQVVEPSGIDALTGDPVIAEPDTVVEPEPAAVEPPTEAL